MRPDDPNLPALSTIAEALGGLRERLVFVGGAIAGLLITDPLAEGIRATTDVAAIVEARLAQFHRIEERAAACGFVRAADSDVVCRWIHRDSGVVFDLMPVDSSVLGFSNRWYGHAMETVPPELRQAVSPAFSRLLSHPDFINALPGLIAEPERAEIVIGRLRSMAA